MVRPQETARSPVRSFADDKHNRWKDDDRRGDKKESRGRHEEVDSRGERTAGRGAERRGEHVPDISATAISDSRRGKEPRDLPTATLTPPPLPPPPPPTIEERDSLSAVHEEGKKKTKSQKKILKKNRKEEESGGGDRSNPEPPTSSSVAEAPQALLSPCKKKSLEKKRKRSRGPESDVSEDELVPQHPLSKRRRGPRTPPPINKDDLPSQKALTAGQSSLPAKIDANFSDWSDDDVPERGETSSASLPSDRPPERLLPSERAPRRGARGGGRDRTDPPIIAPLLPDPPMLIQSLPLQPLLPQHMLRKPQQADMQRSSSMGSNQSRASSRRLRSPSNESAHRDEGPQGLRSRRGLMQGGNSRERERERERERDRAAASEQMGGERKSRIDQLRRGEPSRSTSSGETRHKSLEFQINFLLVLMKIYYFIIFLGLMVYIRTRAVQLIACDSHQ